MSGLNPLSNWQLENNYNFAKQYVPYYLLAEDSDGNKYDGVECKLHSLKLGISYYALECFKLNGSLEKLPLSYQQAYSSRINISPFTESLNSSNIQNIEQIALQALMYKAAAKNDKQKAIVWNCQHMIANHVQELRDKIRWLLISAESLPAIQSHVLQLKNISRALNGNKQLNYCDRCEDSARSLPPR